jgi:hypothetical protein
MDSRVKGTAAIVQAIAQLKSPPRILICSSGVGYYGYQGSSQVSHLSGQRPPTVAQRLFSIFFRCFAAVVLLSACSVALWLCRGVTLHCFKLYSTPAYAQCIYKLKHHSNGRPVLHFGHVFRAISALCEHMTLSSCKSALLQTF